MSDYLYLSQEEVIACGGLDMKGSVENMEKVFAIYGRGEYVQPNKTSIRWSEEVDTEEKLGRIMCMPAYLGGEFQVSGVKWIHSVPQNPYVRNLPRGVALIILTEPETGMPLALMDGTLISAMRTGSVTGLGAKYLADPASEVVAVVGAGVQARTQLMALMVVLPHIKEVKLYDPLRKKAEAFLEEVGPKYSTANFTICSNSEECVRDAQVVTTPTMAKGAYLEAEWFMPGSFYADISSHDPKVEVYMQADKLVVDDLQEVIRYGKVALAQALTGGKLSEKDIYGNLGEIVTGSKPGRENQKEKIVFRPIGLGVTDIGEAFRIFKFAKEEGIGTKLKLWEKPFWV